MIVIKEMDDLYRLTNRDRLALFRELVGTHRTSQVNKAEVPSVWNKIKHHCPYEFEETPPRIVAYESDKSRVITIRVDLKTYHKIRDAGAAAMAQGTLEKSTSATDAVYVLEVGLKEIYGE